MRWRAELPRLKILRDVVADAGFPRLAEGGGRARQVAAGRRGAGGAGARRRCRRGRAPTGCCCNLLDRPDWHRDPRIAAALREPLLRLCARYLLHARAPSGRALDPVAHFHLSNGARVERLNWLGDVSPKGLRQSAGMMVNYLYRLGDIEANHEAYRDEGRVVAASAVRGLTRTRVISRLAILPMRDYVSRDSPQAPRQDADRSACR